MTEQEKKRQRTVLTTVGAVALVGLCVAVFVMHTVLQRERRTAQRHEAASIRQSVAELSEALFSLETDLRKGAFVSGNGQTVTWAAQAFAQAAAARTALETLPIYELHLGQTEEYLNRVGEYVLAAAQKQLNGEPLSQTERETLQLLALRSRELADGVSVFAEMVSDENPDLDALDSLLAPSEEGEDPNALEALEEIFASDRPLIYHGAHSEYADTASWLDGRPQATEKGIAVQAARLYQTDPNALTVTKRDERPIAFYEVAFGEQRAAYTVKGGILYAFTRMREPKESLLSPEAALYQGKQTLESFGFPGMEAVEWTVRGHTVTAVYVANQGGALVYADEIRLSVALDDGGILWMDAERYLLSHRPSRDTAPSYSAERAAAVLREDLSVGESRLALLPRGDGTEALCYRFSVCDGDGRNALIFVNAHALREEEILLPVSGADFFLTQ